MVKYFFRSIQARLLLSFLLSALIAVVLVVTYDQWLRSQLLAQADTVLMAKAATAANQLEEFHRSNLQAFLTAGRLPIWEAYLVGDETSRKQPALIENITLSLQALQIEPWSQFYALSFGIYDIDGNNVFDTVNANVGTNALELPSFQQTLNTGVATISDIYYLPERSGAYFYYLVPIRRNAAPHSVIGLLRVEVSVGTLQNLILKVADEETVAGMEYALFDRRFVRIADSANTEEIFRTVWSYSPQEIRELREENILPPLSAAQLVHHLPALANAMTHYYGETVLTSPTSLESGESRIAVYHINLQNLNWFLTASQTVESFYAPIQQQTQGLIFLSILFLTGAIVSSSLIARTVNLPIQKLIKTVEAFGHGDLVARVDVRSEDEVGRLGLAFNEMAQEVTDSRENLEQLVTERTESLLKSNEALLREIAERKRLEAQNIKMALESERTSILGRFIQDSSHEFKTPLSLINVKLHMLKRMTDEKLQRYLDDIQDQSHQIEIIVNTMVQMSRLDTISEFVTSPIFVDDFLKSIEELNRAYFVEAGLQLRLELHAGAAAISVDVAMLRDAVGRLLQNARQHTASGGIVTLVSESDTKMVEIRIQDTGVGMSSEVQERAFERFYRGDIAHTTRGIGLGLPIAKRIIELCKGEIILQSSPMEGTTLIIRLPRTQVIRHETTPREEAQNF